MKKLLALLLVFILALTSVTALAAKSPNSSDLNKKTNNNSSSNNEGDEGDETDEGEEQFAIWVSTDAARIAKANDEIAKLAEGVESFFGAETFAKIAAILGEGEYDVHEFQPLEAAHADKIEGDEAAVSIPFATPYPAGSDLAVVIGIGGIWNVMAGSAGDGQGTVSFSISAQLAAEVEAGEAYAAIVSKK